MDEGYAVVVGAFKDEATASEVYATLKHTSSTDWLKDVAIVVRDGDRIKVQESEDTGASRGSLYGGVIGALVGVFAGPLGWAALGGALIGGLVAKFRDTGLPDKSLKHLGEALQAGQAAIVALVRADLADRTVTDLQSWGAVVTTEGLDAETVERLRAAHQASQSQASE
jgi:uncharacterized membrane protein